MSLPAIPGTFRWTDEAWGSALRCLPLEAIAPHLFTTRQLQLTSAEDARRMAAAVGAPAVDIARQIHGREVAVVRDGRRLPGGIEADALVSNDPAIAIAVRTADCVPLLMADRVRGVVAAVHAGWRGTAARVAVAALDGLAREFGTRPGDVVAALGPSIGPCCYEVGSELVDAFAAAGHERDLIDRWFVSPAPADLESRGPFASRRGIRLDVAGANRDQLVLAGVNEADIHLCALCTAMHLDLFTSYRAEKANAGRLGAVIAAGDGRPATGRIAGSPRPSPRSPAGPRPC